MAPGGRAATSVALAVTARSLSTPRRGRRAGQRAGPGALDTRRRPPQRAARAHRSFDCAGAAHPDRPHDDLPWDDGSRVRRSVAVDPSPRPGPRAAGARASTGRCPRSSTGPSPRRRPPPRAAGRAASRERGQRPGIQRGAGPVAGRLRGPPGQRRRLRALAPRAPDGDDRAAGPRHRRGPTSTSSTPTRRTPSAPAPRHCRPRPSPAGCASTTRSTTRASSFRRELAIQVGGYQDVPYHEDYDLVARMLAAGGPGGERRGVARALQRRQRHARASLGLRGCCATSGSCSVACASYGVIGRVGQVRNLVVRGTFRLVPGRRPDAPSTRSSSAAGAEHLPASRTRARPAPSPRRPARHRRLTPMTAPPRRTTTCGSWSPSSTRRP